MCTKFTKKFATAKVSPAWYTLLLCFLTIIILDIFIFQSQYKGYFLANDTDPYMRMVRVETLLNDGDWYNQTIARSNAPFGEELHWSRAFDLLIIFLMVPFLPFMDQHAALQYSGALISPLLKWLSLPALFWATQPFLKRRSAFLACVLFLMQWGVIQYYAVFRPDHHSLLLLLFILFLGATLRAQTHPDSIFAYWAGFLNAVSLWVSIESLLLTALFMGCELFFWVTGRRSDLRNALRFQSILFAASCGFLLIERPISTFDAIVYDKISIVYLFAFALLLFFISCLQFITSRISCSKLRLLISLVITTGLLGIITLTFPQLLKGPFSNINPQVAQLFVDQVIEMQPLSFKTLSQASTTVLFAGPILFALPGIWLSFNQGTEPPDLRKQWALITLLTYTFLSFQHLRSSPYAEIAALLFSAPFLELIFEKARRIHCALCAAAVQFLALGIIGTGPILFALFLTQFIPTETSHLNIPSSSLHHLNQTFLKEEPVSTILADISLGPQILYETKHRVIATPYHRNTDGILFWFRVMSANPDDVKAMLASRQVSHILIMTNQQYNFGPFSENLFYHLLTNPQTAPNWLEQVPLDSESTAVFILYKIKT